MSRPYDTTLPRLLVENARKYGDRVALREKELGIWRTVSWRRYHRATAEFAAGLESLGFGPDDILMLIGDNRPEWLWSQIAIQSLGGMSLGLYQDSPGDEIAHVFETTEARVVVAEDQEQVDKILSIRPELPHLKYVIFHDRAV